MGGNIATFHCNSSNWTGISSPHFSYNMCEHTQTQNLSSTGHGGCKAGFSWKSYMKRQFHPLHHTT